MNKSLIKNICDISDCLHVTPEYVDEGYPMVRVSEIGNDFLNLSKANLSPNSLHNKFLENHALYEKHPQYGIAEYKAKTAVVANFYKGQNKFTSIQGVGNIDEIFASIAQVVDRLNSKVAG